MNDLNGLEIKAGDHLVWAGRRGSSVWLNTGFVLSVDIIKPAVLVEVRKSSRGYGYKPGAKGNARRVWIRETERALIIADPSHLRTRLNEVERKEALSIREHMGVIQAIKYVRQQLPSAGLKEAMDMVRAL